MRVVVRIILIVLAIIGGILHGLARVVTWPARRLVQTESIGGEYRLRWDRGEGWTLVSPWLTCREPTLARIIWRVLW